VSSDVTGVSLDRHRTAVLAMDLQAGVVSVYVKDPSFLPRTARLIDDVRTAHVPLVYVKVVLRPGVPEASPRNRFLSAVKASDAHQRFFQRESGDIHGAVAPQRDDLVVAKSHISAFAGTDLDLLLRAKDVNTIVLLGIATSGVVLSTALQAIDLDYRVIIVADCCADDDPDVHACVVEKILKRLAIVASADDVALALAATHA
jgi:nicotinamidase-related amidase